MDAPAERPKRLRAIIRYTIPTLFALAGLLTLLLPPFIDVVYLDTWAPAAWGVALTLGGLSSLPGLLLNRWLLEYAALPVLVTGTLIYAVSVIASMVQYPPTPTMAGQVALSLVIVVILAERLETMHACHITPFKQSRSRSIEGHTRTDTTEG